MEKCWHFSKVEMDFELTLSVWSNMVCNGSHLRFYLETQKLLDLEYCIILDEHWVQIRAGIIFHHKVNDQSEVNF